MVGDKGTYELQIVPKKQAIKNNPELKALIESAPAGRWVVLEPVKPTYLPGSSQYRFRVGPNVRIFL